MELQLENNLDLLFDCVLEIPNRRYAENETFVSDFELCGISPDIQRLQNEVRNKFGIHADIKLVSQKAGPNYVLLDPDTNTSQLQLQR